MYITSFENIEQVKIINYMPKKNSKSSDRLSFDLKFNLTKFHEITLSVEEWLRLVMHQFHRTSNIINCYWNVHSKELKFIVQESS